MPKYKEYVKKMIDENKEVFTAFKKLHDEYALDTTSLQRKYNEEGGKIADLVREYEDRLCRNTERGAFNKFSGGLSEKFHAEVKKIFPMIDHIGLVPQEPKDTVQSPPTSFSIKKIQL
jgi:hypothetical protein